MKRIISLGLMLAAILTLTNCIEEIDAPKEAKGNFTVTLSTDTKTATDGLLTTEGLKIKWVAGDQINVFHAEAGTTTYVDDNDFTVNNITDGSFLGTLGGELTADAYDWYFLYPYLSTTTDPTGSSGAVTIGHIVGETQTQVGNSNTAHLAGPNFPLSGRVIGVAKAAIPTAQMQQLASVIEVKVKNLASTDLTVASIDFTAPQYIVGNFKVDFTSANPSYTAVSDVESSSTAKLTVTDATALATNAEATFYLGIKPFSAAAGNKIKITVNGYEKEIALESAITFNAGKIGRLKFDFDKPSGAPTNLYICGTGVEEGATAKFNAFGGGYFVLHQKLKSGEIYFSSEPGGAGTKYYNSGNSLRLGTKTHTVTDTENVTRIIVNFSDYTVTYLPVKDVKMMMSGHYPNFPPVISLAYKGDGVFEGQGNITFMNKDYYEYWWVTWPEEERYHFLATIGGTQYYWGSADQNVANRPDGLSGEALANYLMVGSQHDNLENKFDYSWKLATNLKNTVSKVTLDTKTSAHYFTKISDLVAPTEIPTELELQGSGTEDPATPRAFRKESDGVFVIYTQTHLGKISFKSSTKTYFASETGELFEGTGDSNVSQIQSTEAPNTVLRIIVNFNTKKVSFDIIPFVRLIWTVNETDAVPVNYVGGGKWEGQATMVWPTSPWLDGRGSFIFPLWKRSGNPADWPANYDTYQWGTNRGDSDWQYYDWKDLHEYKLVDKWAHNWYLSLSVNNNHVGKVVIDSNYERDGVFRMVHFLDDITDPSYTKVPYTN